MRPLVHAEFRRLRATRMWPVTLLVAALLGGGKIDVLAFAGPESFQPPMPGPHTEAGVRAVLGFTAFAPAAIGTLAVTYGYRHRTRGFLAARPRR